MNTEQEKEFKEIAKKLNLREETVSGVDERGMVLNFILKVADRSRQEGHKEGYSKCWQEFKDMDPFQLGRQEGVREAKQKIEKMKMSEKGVITIEIGNGNIHKIEGETDKTLIYNQALSDALASREKEVLEEMVKDLMAIQPQTEDGKELHNLILNTVILSKLSKIQ